MNTKLIPPQSFIGIELIVLSVHIFTCTVDLDLDLPLPLNLYLKP